MGRIYRSYEDYLYHYGVKGMKWGVRKDRYRATRGSRKSSTNSTLSSLTNTAKKKASSAGRVVGSSLAGMTKKAKKQLVEMKRKQVEKKRARIEAKQKEKEAREAKQKQKEKEARDAKKPEYKRLSDEELISRTDRLKLENNYREALSKQKEESKGEKFKKEIVEPMVKDMLLTFGKQVITPKLVEVGKKAINLNNIKETSKYDKARKEKQYYDDLTSALKTKEYYNYAKWFYGRDKKRERKHERTSERQDQIIADLEKQLREHKLKAELKEAKKRPALPPGENRKKKK